MFQATRWAAGAALILISLAGPGRLALAESGSGAMNARDLANETVTVDERAYRVTDRTVIEDADGMRVGLEALPDPSQEPVYCEYEAVDHRDGAVLQLLRLVEIPD